MMCDESAVDDHPSTCVDGADRPVDHDIGGVVHSASEAVSARSTSYRDLITILRYFGVLLYATRKRQRLSLRQAARRTGVSFNTIARLEKRGVPPHLLAHLLALLAFIDDAHLPDELLRFLAEWPKGQSEQVLLDAVLRR